jgi:hypothetical protein
MNVPNNQFNEQSNTNLKSMLEHKLFWFASEISETEYKRQYSFKDKGEKNIDGLEETYEMITLAKDQISLIVGKQNSNGLTTFGMPESLGAVRKKERMRKDLYSAALLGAWGCQEYLKILEGGDKNGPKPYNPIILTT